MKRRSLVIGAWCLSLLLCLWLFVPAPVQAQLANALTRAALQGGTFIITGTWDMGSAAHWKPRRASSAPTGCTVGDAYFNTVSNNWWYCAVAGTWTTVAAGNFANPYAPNQTFSGIVDFTGTVNLPRQQTIEVCKAGCNFTTISSALASITDSSTTKRYVIFIHDGDYDETVAFGSSAAKSYITLRGASRGGTRLRGAAGGAITLNHRDLTEIYLENMTIGGNIPINILATIGTGAPRTTMYITDCILGIIDGTENAASGKSIDGVFSTTNAKNKDIYVSNTVFHSTFDTLRCSENDTVYSNGNTFVLEDQGTTTLMRAFSTQKLGCQIYDTGSTVIINKTTAETNSGLHMITSAVNIAAGSGGNRPTLAYLTGTKIRINVGGGVTEKVACASAGDVAGGIAQGAMSAGSGIILNGVDCEIFDSGATWEMHGIFNSVDDADWANFSIKWQGGRISRSGGSGTNDDFSSAITAGGFSTTLTGIVHAGVYTGAGIQPIFGDVRNGKFAQSLTLPVGVLTCGAGKAGLVATHTTPFQYCDNAGTPALQYAAYGSSTGVATSATALAANGGNCSGNNFALGVDASGVGECAQPAFSNLSGSATDGQLPVTLANHTLTAPAITLADLVVGTCTLGVLGIDSGGATKEWCVCGTTNVWGCWKLTDGTFNANGPAD